MHRINSWPRLRATVRGWFRNNRERIWKTVAFQCLSTLSMMALVVVVTDDPFMAFQLSPLDFLGGGVLFFTFDAAWNKLRRFL